MLTPVPSYSKHRENELANTIPLPYSAFKLIRCLKEIATQIQKIATQHQARAGRASSWAPDTK